MTLKTLPVALCSAVAFAASDDVPDWINLLPAGPIRTVDGRGPYTVASMAAVIAGSLSAGQKLAIDENHATDKGGAALGMPAPARGWIVELQAREDGLWGRVEWTAAGRALMADKAYAGISPVVAHTAGKQIMRVLRASLTNTPNLQGLVSLHSEEGSIMDWKAKLIEMLGLDSNADDAAIDAALSAKMSSMAMQSAGTLNLIDHPTVIALQGELSAASAKITLLTEGQARKDATSFVDAAIREGRVGIKPLRDDYIALHMQDPARAEKLINGMLKVDGESRAATVLDGDPVAASGLTAEDRQVMAMFGVSEDDYKAEQKRLGLTKEAL